jgi:hypothetical protein
LEVEVEQHTYHAVMTISNYRRQASLETECIRFNGVGEAL